MFERASLRLAGWYLFIVMIISLLFSVLVYDLAMREVTARFDEYNAQLDAGGYHIADYDVLQRDQIDQARQNIILNLVGVNAVIALLGGVGSFFLARQTLNPIKVAHEKQRRFVGDASHELRTPLAVMKTEIEVALSDPKTSKAALQELLESNLDEVNRLTELSRILLSLSRNDGTALERGRVDITEQLQTIVRSSETKRLKLKLSKKPLFTNGNSPAIEELFRILIDNALRYSPPASTVKITAENVRHAPTITITNKGAGITKRDMPYIFDRFYRSDTARNRDDGGFGLGLSLAKQIADLHDATIAVESRPYKTTSFSVTFPKNLRISHDS